MAYKIMTIRKYKSLTQYLISFNISKDDMLGIRFKIDRQMIYITI